MSKKESFEQMIARVTAKRATPNAGAPPKPPTLSPSPVKLPAGSTPALKSR